MSLARPHPRQIFLSALALLILSGIATGYTLYKLYQGEQWVRHSYDVEVDIGNLQLALTGAARDRLAYVAGDTSALSQYENARKTAYARMDDLCADVADNTNEVERCRGFRKTMDGRLKAYDESVALAENHRSTLQAQQQLTDESLRWNFQGSAITDQMKGEEERLLSSRDQLTAKLFARIVTAIVFSFLLSVYLIWEHYRRINSELVQRTLAQREAQNLSTQLLRAQDQERRRISRELHDDLGQNMVAAKMIVDSIMRRSPDDSSAAELAQILDQALAGVRTMSYLLHPPMLDEVGLASAAEWFVDGYSKRTGIAVSCGIGGNKRRLEPSAELTLFRILQESLTNIQRHARASKAEVQLDFHPERVSLRIRDHGVGIAPDSLEQFQNDGVQLGVGLAGMRQRVKEQNGTFKLSSDTDGTTISVQLPTA